MRALPDLLEILSIQDGAKTELKKYRWDNLPRHSRLITRNKLLTIATVPVII